MSHVSALVLACLTLAGCSESASSDSPDTTSVSGPAATSPSHAERIAAAEQKLATEQAELQRLGKESGAELAALKVPFDKYAAEIDPILALEAGPLSNNDPAAEKRIEEMKKQRSRRAQELEKQTQDARVKWEPRLAAQRSSVQAAQAERDALLGIVTVAKPTPTSTPPASSSIAQTPLKVLGKAATAPIEDPATDLKKRPTMTAHMYVVGDGDGEAIGYGGNSSSGKARFIRLQYEGGDWDQDAAGFGDLNLLVQFQVRTGIKVAEQPEVFAISRLANFKLGVAPPLVYLTGSQRIDLTKDEVKVLRDYLVDNHGMLLIDNGGSKQFHDEAFAMMKRIVPVVEPIKIPLDDPLHEGLTSMPIVAPHGGRDPYGWKVDGRWIAYYHPGDIGDAWSDDHAGVGQKIADDAYHFGVSIMLHAQTEYAKWSRARGFK